MALLRTAFEKLGGTEPEPQVVVLLAGSGLGKTRIAQEFYNLLSAQAHGDGSKRYWPAALDQIGDNLKINPDLDGCNSAATLPFLWWGIRLRDPEKRNQPVGNALSDGLACLKPHLEPLYAARRKKGRLVGGAKSTGGVIVDLASDVTGVSAIRTLGKYAFEVFKLGREEAQDREVQSPDAVDRKERRSAADALVRDFSTLLGGDTGQRVPAVLLIDDGQFSPSDPDVVDVVDRLIEAAFEGNWPLMILVTHWEAEWHSQSALAEPRSIARAILDHRARYDEAWQPILLGRVDDLEPMIASLLPGLEPSQRRALLARADGNPQFLAEICHYAASKPRYFVDRDTGNALTVSGLETLLGETVELENVIFNRVRKLPESVQRVIALGSVQGVEFVRALVEDVSEQLGLAGVSEAIIDAEMPHAIVRGARAEIVTFAQRIYRKVASELVADLFDPETVEAMLVAALRRRIEDDACWAAMHASERLPTILLARTIPGAGEVDDLSLAIRCGDEALRCYEQGAYRTAALLARTLAEFELPTALEGADPKRIYAALGHLVATSAAILFRESDYLTTLDLCVRAIEFSARVEAVWGPAKAAVLFGDALLNAHLHRGKAYAALGDNGEAVSAFSETVRVVLKLRKQLGEEDPIAFAHGLAAAYMGRGQVHAALGDVAGSIADFEQAIEVLRDTRLGQRWGGTYEITLADAYTNRGNARCRQGELQGAEADHRAAIALHESAKAREGDAWTAAEEGGLAAAYSVRGVTRGMGGDFAGGVDDQNTAIELLEQLAHRLGADWDHQFDSLLASAYMNRGVCRGELQDWTGAGQDYTASIERREAMSAGVDAKSTPNNETDLAKLYMNRALVRSNDGDDAAAVADYDRAMELWRDLEARGDLARTDDIEANLAVGHRGRGLLRSRVGDLRGAVADFEAAIEMSEVLRKRFGGELPPAVAQWVQEVERDLAELRRMDT